MRYSRLAELYQGLEKTSSRLKKTEMIADLLKQTPEEDVGMVAMMVQGRVFPAWSEEEVGIANLLMLRAISHSMGFPMKEVEALFTKTGDLGLVAEELAGKRKQRTLFSRKLAVRQVYDNIQRMAGVEGKGSQERKFSLVSELLGSAGPKEARYIVRTILGDMRIGVAQGVIRDAIAQAFLEGEDAVKAVEWAWFLRADYGEVARIAKNRGLEGLRSVSLQAGRPYKVLLAEKAPSLKEALEAFESPLLEYKYDGARLMIHKRGDSIWLFTRRMENVSRQFPEVVERARACLKPKECIVEGEMLAIDKKTGKPMAFQALSQRIKRKYGIDEVMKEIPVELNLFDIVLLDGDSLFGKTQGERKDMLKDSVLEKPDFRLAKTLKTKDLKRAERFYTEALRDGQEGVMVKNMDSMYYPGRRVAGGWLKVKPVLEPLDLAVIGAVWGTGKRAGWLGSLILGCRDGDRFLECGMLGTGIKEKLPEGEEGVTFSQMTGLLKPHISSESHGKVSIRPSVVVEVAYEEIQKSPNYSSGYALRFPRFLRLRTADKGPEDVDTLERLESIYEKQKSRGP